MSAAHWLAGVLDVAGCWSAAIAGQDGRSLGVLRCQLAGPAALVEAIQAAAGCGTLRGRGARRTWSVAGTAARALAARLTVGTQVRRDLYRRLAQWPSLASGERATPEQRALRRAIADDIPRLDPLVSRTRPGRRARALRAIRRPS